ncbi:hypothetical protein DPMN_129309 [Dreissena polymorpha]|uniref:Uncharacterized protein n=1 Tax=Dreissena polymorpha TaxID=45954 RepID=A0A9D4K0Y4_DREPO|nr:hypothetical protein DPMN_129309 [Dreissena polymorpha]
MGSEQYRSDLKDFVKRPRPFTIGTTLRITYHSLLVRAQTVHESGLLLIVACTTLTDCLPCITQRGDIDCLPCVTQRGDTAYSLTTQATQDDPSQPKLTQSTQSTQVNPIDPSRPKSTQSTQSIQVIKAIQKEHRVSPLPFLYSKDKKIPTYLPCFFQRD